MGPAPAVAAVRLAVRRTLTDCLGASNRSAGPILVACSGGADSLALLAATVFEARKLSVPVVGATVDHGLQDGSADRAAAAVAQMQRLGVTDTVSVRVRVNPAGEGIEAAARRERYAALSKAAAEHGSSVVLLGHTRDDQAETVLLGLTRGSGGRSLAGMPRSLDGLFLRPLLDVTRAETEAACRAEGICFWTDPHNEDPRFTRSRIRHRVLPVLEAELGPGVGAALARTAEMVRSDVEALDRIAQQWYDEHRLGAGTGSAAGSGSAGGGVAVEVAALAALDEAIRLRVLRLAALDAGCPPGELFRVHVLGIDELVMAYRGQTRVELPGHVQATRSGNLLRLLRL
ncbi:MAG TPA: tRNA lysidine(34) synthetase TilS [Nocardioidaceae bacterium]|nr:tRNA lysidine(34) synthetase TilS [Nocardioidaceae bacterium]